MLAQSYGQTVYAVGVVLTAFMAGLSLGSYLLGKAMDRSRNLLFWYAAMEAGIALLALLSIFLLRQVPELYIKGLSLETPLWVQLPVTFTVSMLMIIPPTFLMGGTLPVLSKIIIRDDAELEGKLGNIYSINTLGGALGTLLAGFVLIHHAGINATIMFGVVINSSIAIYIYMLSRKSEGRLVEQDWKFPEAGQPSLPSENVSFLVFLGLMLSGCSALIYEVAWNRLLVAIIGSTTYSFSLILFGVLLGIGLGSLAVSYISKRRTLGLGHFAGLQLYLGATCFVPVLMFNYLPAAMHMGMKASGGNFAVLYMFKLLIVLTLVLAPIMFLGASFPIIGAIYRRGFANRGGDIGSLYAINTAGAIAGTALASFWLLPAFGTTVTIKSAAMINVLTGVLALWAMGRGRMAIAAAMIIAIPLMPLKIPISLMDTGVAIYGYQENYDFNGTGNSTVFLREGLNANISVTAYSSGQMALKTNGKVDAGISGDMPTQLATGYVPMLLHPAPRDVMLIGLGIGVTLRSISEFRDVERIDCVEIEPAVLEAMKYFTVAHHGVLSDPRVSLTFDDARKYMLMTGRKYDVIISSPSNPWISGIGNIFTREFYEVSLSRLRQDGLFVQWMHMYGIEPDDLRMIMATMADVFPELSVWQVNAADLLIIGGRGPVDVLDMDVIGRRLAAYKSPRGGDLNAYLKIKSPIELSGLFLIGTDEVRELSGGSMLITDDRPEIEFHAPISMHVDEKQLENMDMLYPLLRPPLIEGYGTDAEAEAEFYYLKARHNQNIKKGEMIYLDKALSHDPLNADYLALKGACLCETGSRIGSREILRQALEAEPENPEANYQMGVLLSKSEGTLGEAVEYYEKAAAIEPGNFDYNAEAGFHNYQLGRHHKSIEYLKRASALPHPIKSSMMLSRDMGLVYQSLGKFELAEQSYKEPLVLNPYYLGALMDLANLYLNTGRTSDACEMMSFAREVASGREKGEIEQLIDSYCRRGQSNKL